uniref:6-hydroxymethyl-7,8-dihydropterin pyrophosphokinase n=1 Tax=Geoglobus ahangari TaxID=113653 RepID=A0A7C3UGT4_9EURY
MNLEDWFKFFYYQILSDFGFDEEKDKEAARLMHSLAGDKLLDKEVIRNKVEGREVAVIGGAVENEINTETIITAGKAILKWMEISDRTPDIHVTDMEEDSDILIDLENKGCLLILHAHGDNIDRIKDTIPKIGRFIGTTQHFPFNRIYNFGGFTDGDRAAIIAKEFGASKIILHGFRFHSTGIKGKKLTWAKRILKFEGIIEC